MQRQMILHYGWRGRPNLADEIELIRKRHSAGDGSYDADEVRLAMVAEIKRRKELAEIPLDKMAYEDFLQTDYWHNLSDHMKWLVGYTCERCHVCPFSLGYGLNVHHRTYAHRGFEWDHLDDLEVLCAKCHQEHHAQEMSR